MWSFLVQSEVFNINSVQHVNRIIYKTLLHITGICGVHYYVTKDFHAALFKTSSSDIQKDH